MGLLSVIIVTMVRETAIYLLDEATYCSHIGMNRICTESHPKEADEYRESERERDTRAGN